MQRLIGFASLSLLFLLAVGCGPSARGDDDGGGDDTTGPDAAWCTPTGQTETCGDGFDNDCNGFTDCSDVTCAETEACAPVDCEVTTPSVSFPLPDGSCTGSPPPPGSPPAQFDAFLATCGAYDGDMNLSGFAAGARLTDTTKLLAICATMEHTWVRDLQMEAFCPDGDRVVLSRFAGHSPVTEHFLGEPVSEPCDVFPDPNCVPQPGVGYEYCWTMSATNPPLIEYANTVGGQTLPAGDYRPSEPFTGFADCTLNGEWRIRIIDGWGIDNGVVFATRMVFDASLSDDCPIIE